MRAWDESICCTKVTTRYLKAVTPGNVSNSVKDKTRMQDGSKQSAEKQCAEVGMYRGYVVENWPVFLGLGRENRLNLQLFYRLNTKPYVQLHNIFFILRYSLMLTYFFMPQYPCILVYCHSFRSTLIWTWVKVELKHVKNKRILVSQEIHFQYVLLGTL